MIHATGGAIKGTTTGVANIFHSFSGIGSILMWILFPLVVLYLMRFPHPCMKPLLSLPSYCLQWFLCSFFIHSTYTAYIYTSAHMDFSDITHITNLLQDLSLSPPTMELNAGKPLAFTCPPFPVFTNFGECKSTIYMLERCSDEQSTGITCLNGILMDAFSEFILEMYVAAANHSASETAIKTAIRRFFYERIALVIKHTVANPHLHMLLEKQVPLLRAWAADYDGDLVIPAFVSTITPCFYPVINVFMNFFFLVICFFSSWIVIILIPTSPCLVSISTILPNLVFDTLSISTRNKSEILF